MMGFCFASSKRSFTTLAAVTVAGVFVGVWQRWRKKRDRVVALWVVRAMSPSEKLAYEKMARDLEKEGVELTVAQSADLSDVDLSTTVLISNDTQFVETSGIVDRLPSLFAFILPFAGLPESTRRFFLDKRIVVGNCHANSKSTSELALALVFAAAKRLPFADVALRSGDWRGRGIPMKGAPEDLPSIDQVLLHGKKALVVGYGSIGKRVGSVLSAAGVAVVATGGSTSVAASRTRSRAKKSSTDVKVYPASDLLTLLRDATLVVVCCPHNDETNGLFDDVAFAAMPPKAILVNVSRGPVVNEKSVYNALASSHLGVYASDVWWNYPENWQTAADTSPSNHHDFSKLPPDRVIFSPHRGGAVKQNNELTRDALQLSLKNAANLGDITTGLFLGQDDIKRVDLQKGY